MAASDWTYISTRDEVIQAALETIGAVGVGDTPSGEIFAQALGVFQRLIKSLTTRNLFPWTFVPQSITLVDGQQTYTPGTDPLIIGIEKARLKTTSTGDECPVNVVSWREWEDIPTKDDEGDPISIAMLPQAPYTIYVWPKPNATVAADKTIPFLGITKLKDWDSASGSGDFPAEAQRCLVYQLASDLCDVFGVDIQRSRYITSKAEATLNDFKKGMKINRDQYTTVDSAF